LDSVVQVQGDTIEVSGLLSYKDTDKVNETLVKTSDLRRRSGFEYIRGLVICPTFKARRYEHAGPNL
jgi:hypothetical protein